MRRLKSEVKAVINRELVRANWEHELFVDENHLFGVVAEEIWETSTEYEILMKEFETEFKRLCFTQAPIEQLLESLEKMRKTALLMACEAIQVSAMCEKAVISIFNMEKAKNEDSEKTETEANHD